MASQAISYILFLSFHLYTLTHAHILESNDHQNSSPLRFLNQLSGIQKGNTQKGVYNLKKYLTYLGYINCIPTTNEHEHEHEDTFDGCLELGLKKYQAFFDLNITGALDSATIAHMQKPRCGMPDIYNPNETTTSFLPSSHFSFLPGSPKWIKRTLKYAFDTTVPPKAIPPIEIALKQWEKVSRFTITRARSFYEADISISFLRGDHGDGFPFDGIHQLAHTFPPPDGRVHLDADKNWSTDPAVYGYDVQTVGLHELGHALGLGHSRTLEAIMYPGVYIGERKGLNEDDIAGIRALYKL